MTRQIGPDQSERVPFYTSGSRAGTLYPPATAIPLYATVDANTAADVLAYDGSAIATVSGIPTLYTSGTYEIPLFRFPDVADPVVYTRIGGGPVVPLHPRTDDRIDVLTAEVDALQPGGASEAATTAALVAHEADTTNIHGIANTAVLETTTGAQTKANAAQTAATNAAAALVDDLSGVTDLPVARTALGLGGGAALNASSAARTPKVLTHVTSMQTGHGWTASGALTSNLNDTSDYAMGSQSAIITSKTDTTAATLTKSGLTLDLSGSRQLRVLMKITGGDYISQCLLYWSSDGFVANYANCNIQGPNADPSVRWFKDGEWHWITINVGSATVTNNGVTTGTPNLAAITDLRIRLVSTSGQSISARLQAVQVVERRSFAAGGVVVFTYDDSYRAQHDIAKVHLDKYGFPATAYTITENVTAGDGGNTTYLTTAMLQNLRKNSRWEISLHANTVSNHSRAMAAATSAQGVVYGTNPLSAHELDVDIDSNLAFLTTANLVDGFPGHCPPQGRYSTAVTEQLAKRVAYARAMTGNSNGMETIPVANPYAIRSYVLDNTTTYAYLQTIIDSVALHGGMAVFCCHDIVASPATSTQFSTTIHQQLVDYVATKTDIRVMTLADVMKASNSQDAKTVDVQTFTSSGTWTKPVGAKTVLVNLYGAGGGGGGGARGAAGTNRGGGGGGASGTNASAFFPASALTATVSVSVGAAGAAGAAATVNSTSGGAGGQGGATSFGTYLYGFGGLQGQGGTGAAGGGAGPGQLVGNGGAGGNGGYGGVGQATVAPSYMSPNGGGGGGGISAADVAYNGGGINFFMATGANGGYNGNVDSTPPTAGDSAPVGTAAGGGGGGGGAASITTVAQSGAAGGRYGGAGGGGGASLNGNNSGAGGAGSTGVVVVTTYF